MQENIPIYLVSLEADKGRRDCLRERFPKHYESFVYYPATDGRTLSAKEYYGMILKSLNSDNRLLSPSELGCTLSHIYVLERFIESNSSCALILEDDVIGSDNDIDKILYLSAFLDKNSLFICGGQEGPDRRKYQYGRKTNIEGIYEVSRFSYRYVFRTCCYVVTRESAKQILAYHHQSLTIADRWDKFFKNTDVKIFYSGILAHPTDLSDSHIASERFTFKDSVTNEKGMLLSLINRIVNRMNKKICRLICKIKGDVSLEEV